MKAILTLYNSRRDFYGNCYYEEKDKDHADE